MAKLSVQKVAKAMEKSGGIISVIADRCKVSWPAIDKFLKNHPELKELKRAEDEIINDLAGELQVLLQEGRLKIAEGLDHSRTLVQELMNFKVKITAAANDTYGVWREGVHDDLVLAVALACWFGENMVVESVFEVQDPRELGMFEL